MRNVWISVVVILLSVILFYDTFNIEVAEDAAIGPATWPRILLVGLFVFGSVLFIQSVYQLKKKSNKDSKNEVDLWKFWSFLIIVVLYIPAISILGFIVATPIFIIILALIAGMRKVLPLVLTPLIGTIAVTYIFPILLRVSMPRGIGFIREVSYLFY